MELTNENGSHLVGNEIHWLRLTIIQIGKWDSICQMWPIHNASIYKAGKDVKSFCGKKKNQLYKVYTSVKYLHRNGNMLRTKIIVRHEL